MNTKIIHVISLVVSKNCCDPIASCSCGTHTGHFACVCPAGFYGRGLVGDCKSRSFQFIYSLRPRFNLRDYQYKVELEDILHF